MIVPPVKIDFSRCAAAYELPIAMLHLNTYKLNALIEYQFYDRGRAIKNNTLAVFARKESCQVQDVITITTNCWDYIRFRFHGKGFLLEAKVYDGQRCESARIIPFAEIFNAACFARAARIFESYEDFDQLRTAVQNF